MSRKSVHNIILLLDLTGVLVWAAARTLRT